ncbi:MAG TPA: hypothetical protein V6C58_14260 [Allocoleopsis sp.]
MEELSVSEICITTTTRLVKLPTNFDLECIFINLDIDSDVILGIKYANKVKGNFTNSRSFFNQLTLKIFVKEENKEVNLKVFSNGKFHVTGVKNDNQTILAIKKFMERIVNIEGSSDIPVVIDEDFLFYNAKDYNKFYNYCEFVDLTKDIQKRYMYSIKFYGEENGEFRVIGERSHNGLFLLNNGKTEIIPLVDYLENYIETDDDILDYYQGIYIEVKHVNFVKMLYSYNGDVIGNVSYIFSKPKRSLSLFKCSFGDFTKVGDSLHNFTIFNKNKVIQGKIVIDTTVSLPINFTHTERRNISLKYLSISNKGIVDTIKNKKLSENFYKKIEIETLNINSKFVLTNKDLELNINRSKLNEILIKKYNIESYYNVDSKYPGINVKLHYGNVDSTNKESTMLSRLLTSLKEQFLEEILKLTPVEISKLKVSVLLFQNGKIIISGCRKIEQIHIVKDFIVTIIKENYYYIVNKPREEIIKDKMNNDITIWDLM